MIELIEATSRECIDVKVVPDLLQVIALRARIEDLDGVPVINVNDVPLQGFNSVVKRGIDVAISASGPHAADAAARARRGARPAHVDRARSSTARNGWASTASPSRS